MAKISDITEAKIKAAMRIEDVLADQGVVLRKNGANLIGLCPFHDDRTMGSFSVKTSENICSCFSCGAIGVNPIDALIRLKFQNLSDKEAYPAALRYLAALYNIPVDDEEPPKVEKKMPIVPREITLLPPIYWTSDLVKPFPQFNDKSPLLAYLRSLPLMDVHKEGLEKAIKNYLVGTYPNGKYEGWTIWWYMDHTGYVHSGKVMEYKPDGHRKKVILKNGKERATTWVHYLMQRWKTRNGEEYEDAGWKWDNHTHRADLNVLFGQHLLDLCPKAVVRIVESEKTAVLCSAFNKPSEVLWLATGGMQFLKQDTLLPILKKGRYVELYPDYDGYAEWEKAISKFDKLKPYIESGMLVISSQVRDLWKPEDGGKADIADIMIRIVTTPHKTEADKTYEMACAKLGIQEHEPLRQLIGSLELKIDN